MVTIHLLSVLVFIWVVQYFSIMAVAINQSRMWACEVDGLGLNITLTSILDLYLNFISLFNQLVTCQSCV